MGFQLGIDLGGSKLAIAIADPDARLIAHQTRPSQISGDPEADVSAIAADAADLISRSGLTASDFDAVGLSVPGPIDHERGAVLDPPNLPGWENVPLRARMSELLGLPVRLENDANAAALAEWRYGAGRGAHNLVYLTMSTGVGAGLILDDRLYRGHRGRASEFGHTCIEWGGERCGCGRSGCLEAYLGGASWTRRLREITPTTSRVCALAGDRGLVQPEHVVAAAGEGDAFACEEMERFNHYLARAIAALTFTLAPEVVVLGTIATAAGEELCFEPVRALVNAQVWPTLRDGMRILPSGLGDQLPYYAGVCVAIEGSDEGFSRSERVLGEDIF
ncbi:MAG: ROK family protein [Myxococcales bacterium]|nr:ROK family protein [Myxococcales bacterium]